MSPSGVAMRWLAAVALLSAPAFPFEAAVERAKPAISLTLIPPSPVTDQVTLEIRGAVWNRDDTPKAFDVTLSLDTVEPGRVLHRERIEVGPSSAKGVTFRWPTTGQAGRHRIILSATSGSRTQRRERPIEIIQSGVRSTRRIGGAWVDIYHHSEAEGRYFNADLAKMTHDQWRELVRGMHGIKMNVLVITMLFQNYTHYGKHTIEKDGYRGKAYYPSRLFPSRMPIACDDPLEAILSEADKLGMHVFPGIGTYAFFDFTPASLRWHKKVASEVWERYGHHPSFYGWYVSDEIAGHLGNEPTRWEQIVGFFREFRAHCRTLAPDKPAMLATNSHHVPKAVDTYRKLLPHLDILCPFGFHRMPTGDITGEEAARLLQTLCDGAGCHLWMDLETFVFHKGGALYPRPIGGLISDLRRFPTFEKILCYQYPGLMNAPGASIKPGGPPTVKLYQDYERYLEQGYQDLRVMHAALGKAVELTHPYSPSYTGGGPKALTDGARAFPHYRDPAWQGYDQHDLVATVDLGRPMPLRTVCSDYLQCVQAGIFLPTQVAYAVSDDGKEFRAVARATHDVPLKQPGPLVQRFSSELKGVTARYVRVRARNIKTIPDWHPARGKKAWLFVDEIMVNARPAHGN